ncbi:monocarboxylate transporter 5-like [Haliotis rubra]|uniref:monocarboxylate transporter 5-like n=1 Tax=Haliotis rubra TaxID=36100 RepID=UPI001EE5801C|nr:monocarboxylate transporter 5-like [Haliotis rubra]
MTQDSKTCQEDEAERGENIFMTTNIANGKPSNTGEDVDAEESLSGKETGAGEGVKKNSLHDCDDGQLPDDNQPEEEDDGLPIDRGWAWVVLAGSFLNVIIMVGYGRAIAIFFVAYLEEFEATAAKTTLFMGVMAGTFSISSLFSMNVILQQLGERKTVLLGGTISVVGMLTGVFATSITYLICTHSIIIGIGHSMIHGPALVLIGKYFKKRRGIATSIAMSGMSIGGSVFPPLVRFLLDEYGVRGSMLILTGVTMNVWVGAALFRPLSFFRKRIRKPASITTAGQNDDQRNANEIHENDQAFSGKEPNRVNGGNTVVASESQGNGAKIQMSDNVRKRARPQSVGSVESQTDSLSECQMRLYTSYPDLTSMSMVDIREVNSEPSHNHHETKEAKGTARYLKHALSALDFSLFRQPMFQMIVVVAHFGVLFGLVGIYIPALANEKGISQTDAAYLLTLACVLDFFSRLAVGFVADLKIIKVNHLMVIGILVSGTATHFVYFYNSYALLVVFSVIVGLFGSFYHCLMPVAIVDFMGLEKMAKVLGFLSVFHGLSISVTHPIMGTIRDMTKSYNLCFTYIGIANYITAVVLLCVPLVRRRETKLKSASSPEDVEENRPLKSN